MDGCRIKNAERDVTVGRQNRGLTINMIRTWQVLTNPAPSIVDIEQRQQSRLLAGLAVSLTITSLLASFLLILKSAAVSSTVIGLWFSILFIILVYFANRRGRYRLSAFIFVGETLAVTCLMPILTRELAWLFFVPMVLLLSAVLLPDFVVAIFLITFVYQIILAVLLPLSTSMSNVSVMIVNGIVGPLVLVFMAHRNRLERDRRQEIQSINESLRTSEAQLEQRVLARTAELSDANQKKQEQLTEINLLTEKLREQTIREPLTGLFNRRYLEETLERELSRARRKNLPLGVIMADIDHFKQFNDTHGHAAGDALLSQFGEYLVAHIRGYDIACRYGGEEFTLILPEASREVTWERAKLLLEGARHLQVNFEGKLLEPITLSLGVAIFPTNGATGGEVLSCADALLYRAKHGGRDRIVVADQ